MVLARWVKVCAIVMVLCTSGIATSQTTDETLGDRQESLQGIMSEAPASLVASMRRGCANGIQPDSIKKNRALGAESLPDAADYCAMALYRTARDGQLFPFYRESLIAATGAATNYEQLPAAIGASIMQRHSNQVPLGNGKAASLTPALAWDAGFTIAYQQHSPVPNNVPELAALKPIAEHCLGQREPDLSLCYSTGYMYGLRAVNGLPITASR